MNTDAAMSFLMNHSSLLTLFVLLAPLLLAAPSMIATVRGLPDARKIVVLNVAGGVFFSAWAAAMAWAVIGRSDVAYYDRIMQRKWRYLGLSVSAGFVLLAGTSLWGGKVMAAMKSPSADRFETASVARGTLENAVSATGRLRPSKIVQVASQANGAVVEVLVNRSGAARRRDAGAGTSSHAAIEQAPLELRKSKGE